jgi:hypothetical protein
MSSFRRENEYILNQATDTLTRYDNMRREEEEREKREQDQAESYIRECEDELRRVGEHEQF